MEIAPLLFDLGTSKPTSRQVAELVKAGGGADALTEAIRRADSARYQEIRCRSALNSCKGMPFNWTLNPYRGCTHGCHYCYARRYHTQFELGADDEFASVIFVKTNVVQVLRPGESELSVEGSLTSWIDLGDGGLWIAAQVGDAGQESLSVELSPTTRQAVKKSGR